MKVTVRIGLILGVCALVAALPAGAACGGTDLRSFIGYNYYSGSTGVQADVLGNFWQVGNFGGANNGTWAAPGWVGDAGGGNWYPSGYWQDNLGIVGCPSPVGAVVKMAFAISAPTPSGGAAYGVGCDASDPGSTNFTFGTEGAGAVVPMQDIPKPTVIASSKAGGTLSITVNSPALPGGIVDEAACNVQPVSYRVLYKVVPRLNPAPTDRGRVSGTWTNGPLTAIGNQSIVPVPVAGDVNVWLAYAVVFTDGVETQHVGTNSLPVYGGTTSADRPTDFRIITKPLKKPTSAR